MADDLPTTKNEGVSTYTQEAIDKIRQEKKDLANCLREIVEIDEKCGGLEDEKDNQTDDLVVALCRARELIGET
jgi:hypothetical protein